MAADYANTLAEEFISERLESHWQATQRTSEYLTRQLEELKVRLVASEDELQKYAKATNLQFTSEQGNQSVSEQKLGQLQTELSTAQEDRIAKQSRYELAEKAPIDTLPEVLDDDSLKAYHQKLADAKRQLADRMVIYTAEDPGVKKIQSTINSIESDMGKVRGRILDKIHSELVVAQTRETLLSQAVSAQAGLASDDASKAVHYNILKREVDTNREVWESLLQRVKEAGISAAMRSSNFRVVDPATPPSIPIKPSLRQGVMAGMVLGMFAGIGLVFMKENMDHSIALPGETSYYLGSPELAVVPARSLERSSWKMFGRGSPQKRLSAQEAMVERSAFNRADSMVAESFRVALTSLLFANKQTGPPKAIAISSPGPSEGKTTVACNLAISYAEINWRVLLIDGDMRRPRMHGIFDVDNEKGLAPLLDRNEPTEPADVAAAVRQTAIANLSVMPRGKLRSTVINLLYSPRFAEVLQIARKEFDVIIIDTPPMLHLPDARAIAHLTDGVVFVVRSGKTLRDTVITARERFRQDGIPILGSILNDWNPREIGYYGHDNYEDYRSSYYGKETAGSVDVSGCDSANADMGRRQRLWLFVLFFVSGFPALLYQVVWQRALLTIYGVNIQSVTMIVSVFMLGLGLGSMAGGWISERPGVSLPAVFGLAELGVGVFGFFSLRLFHYVAQFTAGGSTLRTGAVAVCLLLIPTTLMGCTLPILTEYLVRFSGNVGRSVGMLYFVNTLGSAAACFAAVFFLMRLVGESGTVMLAAAINAVVGLTMLGLYFAFGSTDATPRVREEDEMADGSALPFSIAVLVSGMTGMVSLAYEILWYRAFSVSLGGRAPAFAGLLGFFLTGIALGSLVSRSLCRRLTGGNASEAAHAHHRDIRDCGEPGRIRSAALP